MLFKFDLLRLRARLKHREQGLRPDVSKLHFGCGSRRVPGWLNVDVAGSEFDVDLASGTLPWKDDVFDAVVGQQVVEHLELGSELLPLLRELRRMMRKGGELWLACPDMEKICRSYLDDKGEGLLRDRRSRHEFSLGDIPTQHMINVYFHQGGQHKNLFDFELLRWALLKSGFSECLHMQEANLLERFPEFPERNDDFHSLYVKAVA